jgi:hypothetical protein
MFVLESGPQRVDNIPGTSNEMGRSWPLAADVMGMMQGMGVDGMGELDHGARVRYYEKLIQDRSETMKNFRSIPYTLIMHRYFCHHRDADTGALRSCP